MVHYRSEDWVRALAELIEDHSGSLMAIKQSADKIKFSQAKTIPFFSSFSVDVNSAVSS